MAHLPAQWRSLSFEFARTDNNRARQWDKQVGNVNTAAERSEREHFKQLNQ